MSTLELRFLGPPEVRVGGQPVPRFRSRKTLALLTFLALEPRPHPREALAALLWPDSESTSARAALRNTLGFLRETLGPCAGRLHSSGALVELRLQEGDALDVEAVTRAARGQGNFVVAAALWRGEPLTGLELGGDGPFIEWLRAWRDTARRDAAAVLERAVSWHDARGEAERALEAAERWAALEPHVEEAILALMRQFVAAQRPEAARRAFEVHASFVAREFAAAPSETLAAYSRALKEVGKPRPAQAPGAGPLVGRTGEFSRLVRSFHDAAGGGGPGAVIIDGEPGIGKTRLAGEFLTWTEAQGAHVLRAPALEVTSTLPYHALAGAVRAALVHLSAAPPLAAPGLAELAALLPELNGQYPELPPISVDAGVASPRLLAAMTDVILHLARTAPVVLFIDDAQWADRASLDALSYLASLSKERSACVQCVLTLRSEALAEPTTRHWLANLHRHWESQRLTLGPLARHDAREWLAGLVDEAGGLDTLDAWVYRHTAGQPLFMFETVKALRDGAVLRPDGRGRFTLDPAALAREAHVPSGIQDAVRGRLACLSPTASKLVGAAGVLGGQVPLEVLAVVAELDETAALDALDEAMGRGVLHECGDSVAFTHDRLREGAVEAVTGARRRALHRRALVELEQRGESRAVLAGHAHAAHAWTAAVRHDLAAGRAAARLAANHEAIMHLERAWRVVADAPAGFDHSALTPEELFNLLDALNLAYDDTDDRHPGRRAVLESMLAFGHDRRDERLTLRALTELAVIHAWTPGEEGRATARLDEVAFSVPSGEAAVWLECARFYVAARQGDGAAQLHHARAALDSARLTRDAYLIGTCLTNLSTALGQLRDWSEVTRVALDAAEQLETAHHRAAAQKSRVTAAYGFWYAHDLERCVDVAREAALTSRELGSPQFEVSALRPLLNGLTALGQVSELEATLTRFEALLPSRDDPVFRALCLLDLAVARHALGQLEGARAAYAEVEALHAQVGLPHFSERAPAGLCDLSSRRGDWGEAARYARLASERRGKWSGTLAFGTGAREVEALMRSGNEALAHALMTHFGPSGREDEAELWHQVTSAALARMSGRCADALLHLGLARNLAGVLNRPLVRLQVLAQLLRLLRGVGNPGEVSCLQGELKSLAESLASSLAPQSQAAFLQYYGGA